MTRVAQEASTATPGLAGGCHQSAAFLDLHGDCAAATIYRLISVRSRSFSIGWPVILATYSSIKPWSAFPIPCITRLSESHISKGVRRNTCRPCDTFTEPHTGIESCQEVVFSQINITDVLQTEWNLYKNDIFVTKQIGIHDQMQNLSQLQKLNSTSEDVQTAK